MVRRGKNLFDDSESAEGPATYVPTTIPLSFQAAPSQGSPPGKSELQAGAVGCVSAWTIAWGWE